VHRGDVPRINVVGADEVAVYTAALWRMDPADWNPRAGEEAASYQEWFGFVGGCKAVGIPREVIVDWQTRVPRYANDGREIERIWDSAHGRHGGAFFKAVAARRIKLIFGKPSTPSETCDTQYISPRDPSNSATANPSASGYPWRKTIHWPSRVANATSNIHQRQDDDTLYKWALVVWETHFDCGMPTLEWGQKLLEDACPRLIRERGIDAVRRTIRRAYDKVASQQLKEPNHA
jgi:hypothetical protein